MNCAIAFLNGWGVRFHEQLPVPFAGVGSDDFDIPLPEAFHVEVSEKD